jgi:Protein of unknown function (DUF3592)
MAMAWVAFWFASLPWVGNLLSANWLQVDAVVQIGTLQYWKGLRGRDTEQLHLTYTYTWEGKQFTGSRPTLDTASDEVGSIWLRQNLRAPGSVIKVWINPNHPEQSVVNRNINVYRHGTAWLFVLCCFAGAWWFGRQLRPRHPIYEIAIQSESGRVNSKPINLFIWFNVVAASLVLFFIYRSNISAFTGGQLSRALEYCTEESKSAQNRSQTACTKNP